MMKYLLLLPSRKVLFSLVIIFLFPGPWLYSQISTDLRPEIKSPEASAFERYTDMPVNMVTGAPEVSIPLYTIDYKGIKLPIVLEYDTSGVKVEEIASSVGLKWNLTVGGSVSRIIKGAPDEGNWYANAASSLDLDGYYQDYGLTKLESELNKHNDDSQFGKRYQFSLFLNDAANGHKDTQPDLFYFNTLEGNAKFIFNENRGISFLNNTDFQIKETFSNNQFVSWKAVSPNGIEYTYGGSNNIESSYFYPILTSEGGFTGHNHFKDNAWYLASLKNKKNNNSINISYIDNFYSNIIRNKIVSASTVCTDDGSGGCGNAWGAYEGLVKNPYRDFPVNGTPVPTLKNAYAFESHVKSKLISSISAGDIVVNFLYSNRTDLREELSKNPKKLDQIIISYKGGCVKKYRFYYSYAASNSNYPPDGGCQNHCNEITKRLVLNRLIEESCSTSEVREYKFVYNSIPLPHRLSNAQDKWGYYNGKNDNVSLFPKYKLFYDPQYIGDRRVDLNFAKAGTLEKIIYPTGGSVKFEYEQHRAAEPVDYEYSSTPSGYLTGNLNPNLDPSGNSSSYTTSFVMPGGDTFIRISAMMNYPNPAFSGGGHTSCTPGSQLAFKLTDPTTGKIITTITYEALEDDPPSSATTTKYIEPGILIPGRTYEATVQGIGYRSECLYVTASITRHDAIPVYDVGGLRVSRISYLDTNNQPVKEDTYTYSQPKLLINPVAVFKQEYDFGRNLEELLGILSYSNVSLLKTQMNNIFTKGSFYNLTTGFDSQEIDFAGPHISYGKVTSSSGVGYTENQFAAYKNYFELNNYQPSGYFPATPKLQYIGAGNRTQTKMVSETSGYERSQKIFSSSSSNTGIRAININRVPSYSSSSPLVIPFSVYEHKNQSNLLSREIDASSFDGTIEVTRSVNHYYEGNGHYQPTKTEMVNSTGQKIITKILYPKDKSGLTPAEQKLITQNRISEPVREEIYEGGIKASTKWIQYNDQWSGGLVLPDTIFISKGTNSLKPRIAYHKYDGYGNPAEFSQVNGSHAVYLWGYNGQYPIARIENSTYEEIAQALGITGTVLKGYNENNMVKINSLRTLLPEALVSTYTYKPLAGITSETDPMGNTTYYSYDDFNRLETIKDRKELLLEDYRYHYKN